MQRFVDNTLAVTKESVKTVTYESLNNIARLINGFSALLLTFLPGKATILEGVHGWELRPTFGAPMLPRWMENGVSSFNQFIYQLAVDSDALSSEEETSQGYNVISPMSPNSDGSGHYRLNAHGDHWKRWLEYIFSWILFPVKFFLGVPLFLYNLFIFRGLEARSSQGNQHCRRFHSPRKVALRNHMVNRATDKRRGVMEDLHLGVEILIESVFDGVHKAIDFIFSPCEVIENLFRYFRSCINGNKDGSGDSMISVPTDTMGESNPVTAEKKTTFHRSLNTDSRRCQDVIKELGYPYEEIRVVTDDGYVLLLERIPRRDARKVVYLQHGILDSSMGWVCNGIVGSPAFAAFDQGYDVFLGNFRGLVSREHVNKTLSSRQYWRYSINEHGTKDVGSAVEKIDEIKTSELRRERAAEGEKDGPDGRPYEMCSVSHSLGGAAVLMYVITRSLESKPHHLSRLVLLSPAGFHGDSNMMFSALERLLLPLAPFLEPLLPALYIPTRFLRMLVNKLARDFHTYPAVGGLVQTIVSSILGGDSSDWVGALGLPHYNMNDMPGLSSRVALHLAQMKRAGRFLMFDYGSDSANSSAYSSPRPLDLGLNYGRIDIPADLVGGRNDQVVRPSMVRKHYRVMKEAGVEASYAEFEYAHLDFTFSHSEELLAYVMSRVLLVQPPPPPPAATP